MIILGLLTFARLAGMGAKRAKDGEPHNVLAVKMVGLGDTVLMLTPLALLKKRFPEASISVLATPLSSGILATQGINEMIVYDALAPREGMMGFGRLVRKLRQRRFDCVIDFEQHFLLSSVIAFLTGAPVRIGFTFGKSLRRLMFTHPVEIDPGRHMVDSFMGLLGPLGISAPKVEALEKIQTTQQDERHVADWLASKGIDGNDLVVGVHTGTGPRAPSKRWDKDRFASIVRRLAGGLGAKVVLTGTAAEGRMIDEIAALAGEKCVYSSAGLFSPGELAALARRCRLFISNDTGVMHISAAVGTPTIGLFGPESPARYAPVGRGNIALYKPPACSPCVAIHKGESRTCDEAPCMRAITVEDVWAKIADLTAERTAA